MNARRLAFLIGRNVVFISIVILIPSLLLFARNDFGLPGYFSSPLNLLGLLPLALGALLVFFSAWVFWTEGRATPYPELSPPTLVVAGPYEYLRNPEFLGICFVIVGLGVLADLTSLVLESLLAFLVLHLFVMYLEEPLLEKKFGDAYVTYKKEVPRWIPKLRRPPRYS